MPGQSDRFDEARFGVENLLRAAARIDAQQQRDQSRNDGRIADRAEVEAVAVARGDEPDLRLAALDFVRFGLQFGRKWRQLAAEIDQVLVALGPVAEEREFL